MVCNTGVSWTPIVEDKRYTFKHGGNYNGLFLMRDRETASLWHHITGDCVDGELEGAQLKGPQHLHYLTAAEALKRFPQAQFPLGDSIAWWQRLIANIMRRTMWTNSGGMIPPFFRPSMEKRDERLPELEVGIGVWQDDKARFYRLKTLTENGGAVIDTPGTDRLVIFVDPYSNAPIAICTDAETCEWEGNTLILDNGTKIEHGSLKSSDGTESKLSYPRQVFTRWYGFSYTYPDCDIFTLD